MLRVEVLPPISPRPLAHSAAGLRERKSITAIAVSAIQPMLHKFIIILQRREGRDKSIYFLYYICGGRWLLSAPRSPANCSLQFKSPARPLHCCCTTVKSQSAQGIKNIGMCQIHTTTLILMHNFTQSYNRVQQETYTALLDN